MPFKGCEGCPDYILDEKLVHLNQVQGGEVWPLDVEWKNCMQGPDYWLNCRDRKEEAEIRVQYWKAYEKARGQGKTYEEAVAQALKEAES